MMRKMDDLKSAQSIEKYSNEKVSCLHAIGATTPFTKSSIANGATIEQT
jgi:hypothetical protein